MKFRLSTLFIVVALVAFLVLPVCELANHLNERWSRKNSSRLLIELPDFESTSVSTVISVPDGGILLR